MPADLKSITTDAARYWEARRPIYNALLVAVVFGYWFAGLPGSREVMTFDTLSALFVLAVIANVLYSAAYVPDLFMQHTDLADTWRTYRWGLLVIGCAMAATIARFVSMDLMRAGSL